MQVRSAVSLVCVLAVLGGGLLVGESAAADDELPPGASQSSPEPAPEEHPGDVPEKSRDSLLGADWDGIDDRIVTSASTPDGLAILAAASRSGYAWSTVATLSQPGIVADSWIGNTCTTADGSKVVAVYAPRTYLNREASAYQGGYAAVVDLATGAVSELGAGFSLAYFNPGCGDGDQFALTSYSPDGRTRVSRYSASGGPAQEQVTVHAQVTSAIPTAQGLIGAAAGSLVRLSGDHAEPLAATDGVAYDITSGAAGIGYVDSSSRTANVHLLDPADLATSRTVATGAQSDVALTRDGTGKLYAAGAASANRSATAGLTLLNVKGAAEVSSHGRLAVTDTRPYTAPAGSDDGSAGSSTSVEIEAKSLKTGKKAEFTHTTGAAEQAEDPSGDAVAPSARTEALVAGSPTDPVEAERACSVPRNDPRNQALQPKPRQVEWAVDQAVSGTLSITRPANWKNLGMPAYQPQSYFPLPALSSGGEMPPQIMLGVIAQESNMWQASRYTTPGETGNALIGNYYGNDSGAPDDTFWVVDWSSADCGYGVTQMTDGMRRAGMERPGETALPYNQQRAIALDFAANVAAGTRLLVQKWNQTRNAGVTINDGDPQYLENWFAAVWAYNTGFYAQNGSEPWGLGWFNNPVNPYWDPIRPSFLDNSPSDAAHPQRWPYPEKVLGFAAHSLELQEDETTLVAGFRTGWWPASDGADGELNRRDVKPPRELFCSVSVNNCNPAASQQPADPTEKPGPCLHQDAVGNYDLLCRFHGNATWKPECDDTCGRGFIRFDPGWEYQNDAASFPPNCSTAGLPSGSLIVDDVAAGTAPVLNAESPGRPCSTVANAGAFGFDFAPWNGGTYSSKMDLHQLGAAFNDHFYFSHTYGPDYLDGRMRVTGTWTLGQPLHAWTRILVHMPDHGAWTNQATYTIDDGAGHTQQRTLLQRNFANKWVSLGVFNVQGTPRVSLSNTAYDAYGSKAGLDDVAWDAVAFTPLPAKPKDFYVALGDSYSSGEGSSAVDGSDFDRATDHGGTPDTGTQDTHNACHRSSYAWPRKSIIGTSTTSVGQREAALDPTLDFQFLACAGSETRNMLPFETVPAGQRPVDGAGHTGNVPQYRQVTQLDAGFLDANTTLVSLSTGGNDIKFGPILMDCVVRYVTVPLIPCKDSQLDGDSQTLEGATANRVQNEVPTSISVILQEIRKRAPNAKILVMGYPKIFETGSTCAGIADENRPWFNSVADALNAGIQSGVAAFNAAPGGGGATFANPAPAFSGRNLCSADPAINAPIFDLTPGDQPLIDWPLPGPNFQKGVSLQSYHPNKAGTTIYASVFMQALAQMGY